MTHEILVTLQTEFTYFIFCCIICHSYLAADSGRVMQEQMASGGGMMNPQADPAKAFEVS